MSITKDVRQIVARNVKRLRETKEVSVPFAAEAVGVHRSWWNLLEGGTLNFTIDKLARVAAFLDVSVPELMNEGVQVFAQSEAPHNKKSRRRKAS